MTHRSAIGPRQSGDCSRPVIDGRRCALFAGPGFCYSECMLCRFVPIIREGANFPAVLPRSALAVMVVAMTMFAAAGRADEAGMDANARRCLAEDSWCDLSTLTPAQRQRVYERAEQRHLEACFAGKRCNTARLDPQTRERVRNAVRRINYETCLSGSGPCRHDELTSAELSLVIESEQRRNLDRCYSGVTACNSDWLTLAQRGEAHRRYVERNFNSCMETFGTLLPCNPQDLTPEQQQRYRERLLERNYFACLSGLIGCNMDILTSQQRDEVLATQRVTFGSQRN